MERYGSSKIITIEQLKIIRYLKTNFPEVSSKIELVNSHKVKASNGIGAEVVFIYDNSDGHIKMGEVECQD